MSLEDDQRTLAPAAKDQATSTNYATLKLAVYGTENNTSFWKKYAFIYIWSSNMFHLLQQQSSLNTAHEYILKLINTPKRKIKVLMQAHKENEQMQGHNHTVHS